MTLRVTFLGTGGAVPSVERNPSAVLINREGDRLLFDCAEGTQRQMMRYGTGFGLTRIFLTHLHGDHVYGLPGLFETLDFNDRDEPLGVVVPAGMGDALRTFLSALDSFPQFPVNIIEVGTNEVVYEGEDYEVRTFPADHRTRAIGYALIEDDRKGKFDREKAEELGVPVGPKFSTLHEGEPVELADGRVIQPEQVVGPPRPGRRIVYTGDTRPTDMAADIAADADLLIHDSTFAADHAERATQTGHSTAREAGRVAAKAGVKRLALVHLSSRYGHNTQAHYEQAQAVFDGEVLVPDDGNELTIPYSED